MRILSGTLVALSTASMAGAALPAGIAGQLPAGYEVIASARVTAGEPRRSFEIVALGRKDEDALRQARRAPRHAPFWCSRTRTGASRRRAATIA